MKLDILKKVKFGKIAGAAKIVVHKLGEVRPEIMLGAGAIGVLAGTILACAKTKEAEPIVEHAKEQLDELKFVKENPQAEERPTFKEYIRVYARTGFELSKVYAAPAGMWLGGMACIFGSHGEMRSRNAKLLANSVALKKFFDEYRALVREKIGEEAERDLYFGAEDAEWEVEEKDPETGEVKTVKTRGKVFRKQPGSMYARNYTKKTADEFDTRTYNDYYLDAKIEALNNDLKIEGFITLNEVYNRLGFKPGYGKCKDGMNVGWVWNPKIDRGDRRIIVERLEGWEETWDPITERTVMKPCLRLDFNCYPLEGLI